MELQSPTDWRNMEVLPRLRCWLSPNMMVNHWVLGWAAVGCAWFRRVKDGEECGCGYKEEGIWGRGPQREIVLLLSYRACCLDPLPPPPTKQPQGLWLFLSPLSPQLPPALQDPTYCHKGAPIRQLSPPAPAPPPEHCEIRSWSPSATARSSRAPSSIPAAGSALQWFGHWPSRPAVTAGICSAVSACRLLPYPSLASHALRRAAPAGDISPLHACSKFIFSVIQTPG